MADDSLVTALSGFTGLAAGVRDVLVPHMQAKYENDLAIRKAQAVHDQESISGQDIIDANPEMSAHINPQKKYPKELLPFLIKQEDPGTTVIDRKTGESKQYHGRVQYSPDESLMPLLKSDGSPVLDENGQPRMVPKGTRPLQMPKVAGGIKAADKARMTPNQLKDAGETIDPKYLLPEIADRPMADIQKDVAIDARTRSQAQNRGMVARGLNKLSGNQTTYLLPDEFYKSTQTAQPSSAINAIPKVGGQSTAGVSGMVSVINPSGQTGQIPKANLKKALAAGWKLSGQ